MTWLLNAWRRFRRNMEMPPKCTCTGYINPSCPVPAWMESQAREPLPRAVIRPNRSGR